jgi:hypothetical protein
MIGDLEININTKCEVLIKGRSFKSNIQDINEKFIFIRKKTYMDLNQ